MRGLLLMSALVVAPLLVACGDTPDRTVEESQPMPATAPAPIPAPESVEAPPAEAEYSESGLAWIVLEPGDGETFPQPADRVRVHYTGWQTDGTMFDSSVLRGEPAIFTLGSLIPGWVEGIQLMSEGDRKSVV